MSKWFIALVFFVAIAAIAFVRGPNINFLGISLDTRIRGTRSEDTGSESEPAPEARAERRVRSQSSRAPSEAPHAQDLKAAVPGNPPPAAPIYVLNEPTSVYASNSEEGDILTRLQEGDPIEPGLTVLSPEGSWLEVRLNSEKSGFIRTSSLHRN